MKNKMLLFLVLLLLATTSLAGCGDSTSGVASEESDTIKIGVFEPLTGVFAAAGQNVTWRYWDGLWRTKWSVKPAIINTVKDGRFSYLTTVNP